MRAKLASLNQCTVPFLSRAEVNLCWYDSIYIFDMNALLLPLLTDKKYY